MVNLRNCTAEEFIRRAWDKRVVLFGAGKALSGLFLGYPFGCIGRGIEYIVDSDPAKAGTVVSLEDLSLEVRPRDCLRAESAAGLVIVIMAQVAFAEILEFLDGVPNLDGCDVYVYRSMRDARFTPRDYPPPPGLYDGPERIPRVIHYCWFGHGRMSELNERCLASWRRFCPGYEIVRWDESNYDVRKHPYMSAAYDARRWGFVPDYARLDIIYQHGGIYLDTDVELFKPLDTLLRHEAYCGREFADEIDCVNLGSGFGAVKGNAIIKHWLDKYDAYRFNFTKPVPTPSPMLQTTALIELGYNPRNRDFQTVGGLVVYPLLYLNPVYLARNVYCLSPRSYSRHHYAATWVPKGRLLSDEALALRERYLMRLNKGE